MNKKFWKQFLIALLLFLAGYFSVNGAKLRPAVQTPLPAPVPATAPR